jgi:O-antigen biosynthesis protein
VFSVKSPRDLLNVHRSVRSPDNVNEARIELDSKFLATGGSRFWVRGITYGAFAPDAEGREYTNDIQIDRDFAQMAALGFNTVRIPHTLPPRSLFDVAQHHGLRVMAGLSAEHGAGYLIDGSLPDDFEKVFRGKVKHAVGHPALLCLALGNEIPAPQVRWLGRRRVERYLRRLCAIVKQEDPMALVTYVNYPSTEYLDLSFLDLISFNVYLERQQDFAAYLSRLQHIADQRPLLLTELGLDSMRNGEIRQATTLQWQIRETFSAGAAGAVIFSWTDDWCRGREPVTDWAFGITDRNRNPKAAAAAVRSAFADVPFGSIVDWPRISVVVCTFNGSRTIRKCLASLTALDYPDYEVIVIDDGSTDGTAEIVAEFPCRVIHQTNRGLSTARNVGLKASTGEIVAYIDDDAFADRDWLHFLAVAFRKSNHAGVGGPNIAPADGFAATVVARSPGGPCHVMLSDDVAEHIPGCNMAFRRDALMAIGGFDPQFLVAGDDVDICWQIQQTGQTIGFAPAGVVWHKRRNSVRGFLRQQAAYGKAESLLAAKWPEKYNILGHVTWAGRIYGRGPMLLGLFAERVYHGMWGLAPFQTLQRAAPSGLLVAAATPEWYLLIALFAAASVLGLFWRPLWLVSIPLLAIFLALPAIDAAINATKAPFPPGYNRSSKRVRLWLATFLLSIMQPAARLFGRLLHGLAPWRARGTNGFEKSLVSSVALWSQTSRLPERWLALIRESLLCSGVTVINGGPYDRWDLEVRAGVFGGSRLLMAVEDHGSGNQYVRALIRPHFPIPVIVGFLVLIVFGAAAAVDRAWFATAALALTDGLLVGRSVFESAAAAGAFRKAFNDLKSKAAE